MTSAYAYFESIYCQDDAAPGWNTPAVDQEVTAWLVELIRHVGLEPPARVLEIGCGMGNLTLPLTRQGFLVRGLDVSASAIEVARTRSQLAGGVPAVFLVGDATQPGVTASLGPVEAVVDGLCLHCILGEDRPRLLRGVLEALCPGGCFLVMTMCGDPRSADLRQRFDPSTRRIRGTTGPQRYLGRPAQVLSELTGAGFQIAYWRVEAGNDATGDQDMLLVVARSPAGV